MERHSLTELETYTLALDDIKKRLQVEAEEGLSPEAVTERLEVYGQNKLEEDKKVPLWKKFLDQFADFTVILLIIAAIISGVVSDWTEAIIILAIVIINAVLGVIQEGRAEKAIAALKEMAASEARVLRGGQQVKVKTDDLVPGDIILLEAGDLVPADLRILEAYNIKADEAILTGESVPVEKHAEFQTTEEVGLGDRKNMLYSSTAVTYGQGKGIVVATAYDTQVGKIASKLSSIDQEMTPLQKSLNHLGKILGILCIIVSALVFVFGLIGGGDPLELLMTAISLAVAAVPEGLPAVVTIVLAIGMNRMAKKNAIIKRLMAVETLGSIDRICSDKTGTLTQNEMTVTRLYLPGQRFLVTGTGYEPKGTIALADLEGEGGTDAPSLVFGSSRSLDRLTEIASLCNNAKLVYQEEKKSWEILGDPTEGALLTLAGKYKIPQDRLKTYLKVLEQPFDSSRKMMSVVYTNMEEEGDEDATLSLVKGAPDLVLARCQYILSKEGKIRTLNPDDRTAILDENLAMANRALRVLAYAYRRFDPDQREGNEENLIFVGLTGMIDPPREEAKEAIAQCRQAGIQPIMITGDYAATAAAIAEELDLKRPGDGVLSGEELSIMSDEDLQKAAETTTVYARVSPEHKVRIVSALMKNGHTCSMTGDGVNDAPALKQADIGVAMGITGSEVAKSSADMILTDDNFATIVHAVEEGRVIYSNIRKFVGYLLSCNIGEILIIFITNLILGPTYTPLEPIQLLWLNLVTDSFPALALGRENKEMDIMSQKPRPRSAKIIDRPMTWSIVTQALAIFLTVFMAFQIGRYFYPDLLVTEAHDLVDEVHRIGEAQTFALQQEGTLAASFDFFGGNGFEPSRGARTYAFVTLILAELLRAFTCRSERHSVFTLGLWTNKTMNRAVFLSFVLTFLVVFIPALDHLFHTIQPVALDWILILILAGIPFVAGEFFKLSYNRPLTQNSDVL